MSSRLHLKRRIKNGVALVLSGAATLFGLFWLLTAVVVVGVYLLLKRVLPDRRAQDMAASLTEEPGKENLMEIHGREWGLSPSEIEVAVMVVKGFSNAEIAGIRKCALQTVKSQLTSIYQKSGLRNRYQLIAFITDEICDMSRYALREETAFQQLERETGKVVALGSKGQQGGGLRHAARGSAPGNR